MSKRVVEYLALATSDWHLHYWEHYNADGERTMATLKFVRDLFQRASSAGIPVLFAGDLFHTPEGLKSPTINAVYPELISIFNEFPDVIVYGITGNHDQYTKNYIEKPSISYTAGLANTLKNFVLLDLTGVMLSDTVAVYGIPYLYLNTNYDVALEKAKAYFKSVGAKKTILMIHTTIEGSVDTNGYSVTETSLLREELEKQFTLVLSGHIHKHQKISKGIYHIGSPTHVKTSDEGYEPVYVVLSDSKTRPGIKVKTTAIETKVFKTFYEGADTSDPNIMWVYKPKEKEDLAEANHVDITDHTAMMKGFLKHIGVKSPKRKRIVLDILKEVVDDKTD